MAVVTIAELQSHLRPGQRLLGIDVGAKTLGLALSDVTLMVASPLATLRRGRLGADAERLESLIEAHGVGGLVLGLPVGMDGREGRACQSVRAFAANLLREIDIPLAFWDERLSTAAVERMLVREVDLSRRRRAAVIDKLAAAYILQGALDRLAAR